MEHEQAHAVGLLAQHAWVEDEQAGGCGTLTRQVPVGEDADVAAAHGAAGDLDAAAHGLLRGCLSERRGEPNTGQNDSHRNKRTRRTHDVDSLVAPCPKGVTACHADRIWIAPELRQLCVRLAKGRRPAARYVLKNARAGACR